LRGGAWGGDGVVMFVRVVMVVMMSMFDRVEKLVSAGKLVMDLIMAVLYDLRAKT
jgi:hypothetical protein